MMRLKTLTFGVAMLAMGYGLGTQSISIIPALVAQEGDSGLSEDSASKVRAAHESLKAAMDALQQDGRYEGLSDAPNAYLVLSGGGNAMEDLQSGQGVDPESFAALYSGNIKQEIKDGLTTDDNGRLLYNDHLVRMYSRTRLEKVFAERAKLSLIGGSKSPFGPEK